MTVAINISAVSIGKDDQVSGDDEYVNDSNNNDYFYENIDD